VCWPLTCAELIEATRQRIRAVPGLAEGTLVLQGLLGEGAFGKVHTGVTWVHAQRSCVLCRAVLCAAPCHRLESRVSVQCYQQLSVNVVMGVAWCLA
jgi:hypothetical protein